MTRRVFRVLGFAAAVIAVVGAAVFVPWIGKVLAAIAACAGSLALLGAVCLVASWIDGRGKGGE